MIPQSDEGHTRFGRMESPVTPSIYLGLVVQDMGTAVAMRAQVTSPQALIRPFWMCLGRSLMDIFNNKKYLFDSLYYYCCCLGRRDVPVGVPLDLSTRVARVTEV